MQYKTKQKGTSGAVPVTTTVLSKEYWNYSNIIKIFMILILLVACLWATDVHAQSLLPNGGDELNIPGTSDGDSWIKKLAFTFVFIIVLLGLMALGFGIITSIWKLFMVSNDARTEDEGWMGAMKKVGAIIMIIVVCIALFMVINKVVIEPIYNMFG